MKKWRQIRDPQKSQNQKFSKSKSVLPKLSARFSYAGERRPRPIWGPPGPFFPWAGKIQKLLKFCLFSLVGPWALFTRFGALAAIHPRWGNRYFSNPDPDPNPQADSVQVPGGPKPGPSGWAQDTQIWPPWDLGRKTRFSNCPADNRSKVSVKKSQIGFVVINFSRGIFPYM